MARLYARTSTLGSLNGTPACTLYLDVGVRVWITRYMLWINKQRAGAPSVGSPTRVGSPTQPQLRFFLEGYCPSVLLSAAP